MKDYEEIIWKEGKVELKIWEDMTIVTYFDDKGKKTKGSHTAHSSIKKFNNALMIWPMNARIVK